MQTSEIYIQDNERDMEIYFFVNENFEVTEIEIIPGPRSKIPKQTQTFQFPVPLVPNFVRLENIVSTTYMQPVSTCPKSGAQVRAADAARRTGGCGGGTLIQPPSRV